MSITEFLTARLDERQHEAVCAMSENLPPEGDQSWKIEAENDPWSGALTGDMICHPAAVQRRVDADRKVLALCERVVHDDAGHEYYSDGWSGLRVAESTLRAMASAYAGHPDYDPAW